MYVIYFFLILAMEKIQIEVGNWIEFGKNQSGIVSKVYQDRSLSDIEIVYLDDRNRAINEDMVWKEGKWEFKYKGPNGGYADKISRLNEFVLRLRRGR